jgi:hypothetical protein
VQPDHARYARCQRATYRSGNNARHGHGNCYAYPDGDKLANADSHAYPADSHA